MYCVKCGGYIEDGKKFCSACGTPVEDGAVPGQGSANPTGATPTVPVSANVTQAMPAGATMPASTYLPNTPAVTGPAQMGSAPTTPGMGPAPMPQQQIPPAQANAGSSKKTLAIVGAVVAVLAVVGIAIGLTQCNRDDGHGGETVTYSIESTQQEDSTDTQSDDTASSDNDTSSTTTDADANAENAQADAAADQAKREDEARQAARDAGKQVYTGQLIVTTMAQRAHERNSDLHDFDNHDEPYVVLQLDAPMQINAMSGDGTGMRSGEVDSIALPVGQFDAYNGQVISVAAAPEDTWFYSDVTGVLAPIRANAAELVVPIDGSAPAPAANASQASGDYVLADSNSRYYSREELEAMDDLTLYHARNEIFARHGRQFKNTDLQEFFGSKSWYSGTIAPEDFNEQVLNDFETENAKLMLQIEQERNSPYLS